MVMDNPYESPTSDGTPRQMRRSTRLILLAILVALGLPFIEFLIITIATFLEIWLNDRM